MKDRIYLIDLYDLYKDLLTENQRKYFEKYYFEDESLSEIGEIFTVSRAVVQKTIKTVEEKLYYYENILKKYKLKKYIETIKYNDVRKELEDLI